MGSSQQMRISELERFLNKPSSEFTKSDLIKFVKDNEIQMLNLRYVGGDGRLKVLNFVINDEEHLDRLLTNGERVDGSSLLPYIDSGSSDLYVIPRYKTAFLNPFSSIPTLDILCSYFTNEGKPLASAPEYMLKKAHEELKKATGYTMEALGELEYYVFFEKDPLYPGSAQSGYHESGPFAKWEDLRCEVMHAIAQAGGKIKYGHAEVGNIKSDAYDMEQHEIEFLPTSIEDAADQLIIAKWMIKMIGYQYGVNISFAPKIINGHAGSGLHIHTRLMKDGKNMMTKDGVLSDVAKKTIAGFLTLAPSLTAFGNTVPTSYLRLVPHQEAPTNICWGDRNRSVLVRVPLGWLNVGDMAKEANPLETSATQETIDKQTVEFRCPDGSADIYMLLTGLAVAARVGLEKEDALEIADKLYVDVNIFHDEHKAIQERLEQLPTSCDASAEMLIKDRSVYEQGGVFSPIAIDEVYKKLKGYEDKDLSERLYKKDEEIAKLVEKYLHC